VNNLFLRERTHRRRNLLKAVLLKPVREDGRFSGRPENRRAEEIRGLRRHLSGWIWKPCHQGNVRRGGAAERQADFEWEVVKPTIPEAGMLRV